MNQSSTQSSSGSDTLNPASAFVQAGALESWKKSWPKIVARAWSDEAFMQRLLQHPEEIAREYKLPVLEGAAFKVVSGNEPPTMVLSVPPKPNSLKIESMEELADQAEQQQCGNSSCL
jgi:hypothetical protein